MIKKCFIVLLILLISLCNGCVERYMNIRSDPEGAEVWLDGKIVGKTPIKIPFIYHGTRELTLYKKGYEIYSDFKSIYPRWYQLIPIDFITEILWPFTITDNRYFMFTMKPHFPKTQKEKDALKKNAFQLREEYRKKIERSKYENNWW